MVAVLQHLKQTEEFAVVVGLDGAGTLQGHFQHAVVRSQRTGVGKGSSLGLGALAGLHDDAGLGVGNFLNHLEEFLAVLQGFQVEHEGVGVGVVLQGGEQGVLTHHGLVADGDEVGEADALAGGPVHDGGAVGTGLGHEGHVAACGETVGEGGVHVVEGGDVAEAVRAQQVDAVVQALLGDALLELLLTHFGETGGDDGDILGAVHDAGVNHGLGEAGGNEDNDQVHGFRQGVHAGVAGLAAEFLTGHLGVDAVKLALVISGDDVVEYNGAQLGGVGGDADYCNALRIEECFE